MIHQEDSVTVLLTDGQFSSSWLHWLQQAPLLHTGRWLTSDRTLRLLKRPRFSGTWCGFGLADGRLSRLGLFCWSLFRWCWEWGPLRASPSLSWCLVLTGLGAMVAKCRWVKWVKGVAVNWEGHKGTQGLR